jgi:N6-adenosine-specific RNA methylase IME4
LSASTYERAKAVVDAAEKEPTTYGPIRAKMDRTGNVNAAWTRLRALRHREQLRSSPPVEIPRGPFATVSVDPPWAFESSNPARRGAPDYPTMTVEDIKALPVPDIAAKDCVAWLWVPAAMLPEGLEVLVAWGFEYKTHLVWVKNGPGPGNYLRTQHEVCLLGVRGKPTILLSGQTTVLSAPRREHSRKPDEFFAMVESLLPGSKVELFSRQRRPGWAVYGDQVEHFPAAGHAATNGHATNGDAAANGTTRKPASRVATKPASKDKAAASPAERPARPKGRRRGTAAAPGSRRL